ncbi:UNVERIFIED_CONTAM: hypothetical protein JM85_0554 [Acetobacter peroxydans]|jgi:uncharacterized membrane protein YkgB
MIQKTKHISLYLIICSLVVALVILGAQWHRQHEITLIKQWAKEQGLSTYTYCDDNKSSCVVLKID